MRLSAKVLIIGSGPAGASAARYLAAHGRDVLLLEKNLSFEKPCGGGLSLRAFEELWHSQNCNKERSAQDTDRFSPRRKR